MNPTWLTVITAVRDDPAGLEATLDSLRDEDREGVEVLVIDGSQDQLYAPALGVGVARCLWFAPEGIYPAMNRGLEHATGEYVLYLNAGDTLHHAGVLTELRDAITGENVSWMFGPVEIVSTDGRRTVTPAWDYQRERAAHFARGHFPAHQGTIVRTDLLRSVGGFDTQYRIAADYAAFLRLSLIGDPLVLPTVIATFHEGGTSTVHWQESFREFHRARQAILRPTGVAAMRERWDSAWHFGRVFAYRELARRARR
jgi:glycosyltransferase involved in cell wall biosynthesis